MTRTLCLLAAAVALTSAGCSNGTVKKQTLSGTVKYKGQPLGSGIVKLSGANGFYAAAAVQQDGTFIVTDVVPGDVKVGVMTAPQGSGSSDGKAPKVKPVTPASLPAKYREPDTSGLVYPVTSGTRTLDIDIN